MWERNLRFRPGLEVRRVPRRVAVVRDALEQARAGFVCQGAAAAESALKPQLIRKLKGPVKVRLRFDSLCPQRIYPAGQANTPCPPPLNPRCAEQFLFSVGGGRTGSLPDGFPACALQTQLRHNALFRPSCSVALAFRPVQPGPPAEPLSPHTQSGQASVQSGHIPLQPRPLWLQEPQPPSLPSPPRPRL